jgi:hypothetical protein
MMLECRFKKEGDATLEPIEELVIDVDQVSTAFTFIILTSSPQP